MDIERKLFSPTPEWMRTVYEKFNRMFFDNVLPHDIDFEVSNTTSMLADARYWCNSRRAKNCTIKNHGLYFGLFRIRISKYYDNMTEHEAEELMAHEMIHIYQFAFIDKKEWNSHGRQSSHGWTFTEWVDKIRRISGGKCIVSPTYEPVGSYPKHTIREREYELAENKAADEMGLVVFPTERDPKDPYHVCYRIFKSKALCNKAKKFIESSYKDWKPLAIFKSGENLHGYTYFFYGKPRKNAYNAGNWESVDYRELIMMDRSGVIKLKQFPKEKK
jgi:hypothetical protein